MALLHNLYFGIEILIILLVYLISCIYHLGFQSVFRCLSILFNNLCALDLIAAGYLRFWVWRKLGFRFHVFDLKTLYYL